MTDYGELVKALRYCGNFTEREGCDESCEYFNDMDCPKRIMSDAAAAIEDLQVETVRLWPKRGKWINSKARMRPDMCSVCGCAYEADRFMDKIVWNYCPNCGAKMEVQE